MNVYYTRFSTGRLSPFVEEFVEHCRSQWKELWHFYLQRKVTVAIELDGLDRPYVERERLVTILRVLMESEMKEIRIDRVTSLAAYTGSCGAAVVVLVLLSLPQGVVQFLLLVAMALLTISVAEFLKALLGSWVRDRQYQEQTLAWWNRLHDVCPNLDHLGEALLTIGRHDPQLVKHSRRFFGTGRNDNQDTE